MSLLINNGYLPLGAAITDHNEAKVDDLLKEGVDDLDAVDFYDRTALQYAARLGHCSIGNKLLKAGCSVDKTDSNGVTALHLAACKGHDGFVQLLLDVCCESDLPSSDGLRPLHCATGNGHLGIVTKLLERGADVNARGPDNRTALYMAAECGHTEIVTTLIAAHPRLNVSNDYGLTPLGTAAVHNHTDISVSLIKSGARVNKGDSKNNTPLHHAVRNGNLEVVKELLKTGCEVNILTRNFESPVHIAVRMGHVDVLSSLVTYGINVNLCEPVGNVTPLHVAVIVHSDITLFEKIFKQLRKGGCILNWRAFSNLETPFYRALELDKDEIASLLLSNGADPNLASPFDVTALQKACQRKKRILVNMMLNCGINWKREQWLRKFWSMEVISREITPDANINDTLFRWRWEIIPLQKTCRIVVREALGENLIDKVSQLPVPRKMQQFLLLSEYLCR